jgi:hypothetical protein
MKQKRLTGETIEGKDPELPGATKEEPKKREKKPAEFMDAWTFNKRF